MMVGYELYVTINNKSVINHIPIADIIHILGYVLQEDEIRDFGSIVRMF